MMIAGTGQDVFRTVDLFQQNDPGHFMGESHGTEGQAVLCGGPGFFGKPVRSADYEAGSPAGIGYAAEKFRKAA